MEPIQLDCGKTIVIDNGSFKIKSGFSGDKNPKLITPTSCAREFSDIYNVKKSKTKGRMSPIQNGSIVDWESIEHLWEHIIEEGLHADSANHNVLLADNPNAYQEDREKIAECFFETLHTPGLSMANTSQLAMLAAGVKSGVVVDCGDDSTRILPVFNCRPITEAFITEEISGKDITEYLSYLIESEKGISLDQPIINDIKEKVGYVASDYNNEVRSANCFPMDYELENDETLSLGSSRVRCPEPLFKPNLLNKRGLGIHTATFKSISMCKPDIQPSLYENILLVGGTSLLPGFSQRLQKELSQLAPANTKIRILDPPTGVNNALIAWLGGSMLASSLNFKNSVVSKKEYEEYGSSIINKFNH